MQCEKPLMLCWKQALEACCTAARVQHTAGKRRRGGDARAETLQVTIDFEPFKPINTSLYLCDNKFHVEVCATLARQARERASSVCKQYTRDTSSREYTRDTRGTE